MFVPAQHKVASGDSAGIVLSTEPTPAAPPQRALGRDFWLYFSGQLISQIGSSFTLFALPLLVFKLTHSANNLALTTVSNFAPYLLFGLILGALVDRFNRRRMMLLTDVGRAAMITVLPLLALVGALRVEDIYAVAFVQSTLGILFNCGQFAAIPSLVGRDNLVAANARIMATNSVGQILGPILAGVLVTLMPTADLLFFDAASFVVSAASLAAIRRSFNAVNRPGRANNGVRGLLRDVRVGLQYVWEQPALRSISLMMALINFVTTTEITQLVLFAKRVLSASDSEVALLYAAGAAGLLVASISAAAIRRRLSFAVCALGALVLYGLSVMAMALIGSYPAALALWAAASGCGLLLNINTVSLRQAIVPNEMYGRVISIGQVLAWSAIPLGALAGAAAIRLFGTVTDVYAAIGGLTVLIALSFAFSPVAHGDRYLALAGVIQPPKDEATAGVA